MTAPLLRTFVLTLGVGAMGCAHGALGAGVDLQVGVTGEAPETVTRNPSTILASPGVRALVLEVAVRPRSRGYVERALVGEAVGVDDLVAVGLVREEGGRYWLDFNLLTAGDQAAILAAAEPAGRELAQAVLSKKAELDALAAERGYEGRERSELYYFVIGCVALDWDGLDFTRERDYRLGAQRVLDGYEFTPWAKQRDGAPPLRALYWGSHNDYRERAVLTSFGDHDALPRFAFPDLSWNARPEFAPFAGDPDAALDAVGDVMLALRGGAMTRDELTSEFGIAAEDLSPLLDLLARAGYIETRHDRLHPGILVMPADDRAMVKGMVALVRDAIAAWHETHYAGLERNLTGLTPIRNGVPFPRVYTEVWHYVFGVANRTLVERGLFADPYAPDRVHVGFVPVVWDPALWP